MELVLKGPRRDEQGHLDKDRKCGSDALERTFHNTFTRYEKEIINLFHQKLPAAQRRSDSA